MCVGRRPSKRPNGASCSPAIASIHPSVASTPCQVIRKSRAAHLSPTSHRGSPSARHVPCRSSCVISPTGSNRSGRACFRIHSHCKHPPAAPSMDIPASSPVRAQLPLRHRPLPPLGDCVRPASPPRTFPLPSESAGVEAISGSTGAVLQGEDHCS